MTHEQQIALLERLYQHVQNGTTNMHETGGMQSCVNYASPEILEQEKKILFEQYPVIVGVSSQIPHPGDFITKKIMHIPLLLIRDEEGKARGFYNVCRHRAACLVQESEGTSKSFACPYHSWTYNTQGQLLNIPHSDGFPHVDPKSISLVPVQVEEMNGLLFATIRPGKGPSMRSHLEPVADVIESLAPQKHRVFKHLRIETHSNWKQTMEQFLEVYHIKYIHRSSIRKYFVDHVQMSDSLGLHTRFIFPRANIGELKNVEQSQWQFRDYANATYQLFPNTIFLAQQDHLILATLWPNGVHKTSVDYMMLIPEDTPEDKLEHFELNHKIMLLTVDEDVNNGNLVQEGLASGAFEKVHLGRFEQGLISFHDALRQALGE